ncbi:hypothetical protein QBC39DRAFT_332937 [Podospora conica]|nr:hypothetical protein QBC39DRAFT_332937 [Schizothecium conicum]
MHRIDAAAEYYAKRGDVFPFKFLCPAAKEYFKAFFQELRLRALAFSAALEQGKELYSIYQNLAKKKKTPAPGGGNAAGGNPDNSDDDSSDSSSDNSSSDESKTNQNGVDSLAALDEALDALDAEKTRSRKKDKEIADLKAAFLQYEPHGPKTDSFTRPSAKEAIKLKSEGTGKTFKGETMMVIDCAYDVMLGLKWFEKYDVQTDAR